MNFDELEKQWEGGDEQEELRTEQQLEMERLERKRKEAPKLDPRLERTNHDRPWRHTNAPTARYLRVYGSAVLRVSWYPHRAGVNPSGLYANTCCRIFWT